MCCLLNDKVCFRINLVVGVIWVLVIVISCFLCVSVNWFVLVVIIMLLVIMRFRLVVGICGFLMVLLLDVNCIWDVIGLFFCVRLVMFSVEVCLLLIWVVIVSMVLMVVIFIFLILVINVFCVCLSEVSFDFGRLYINVLIFMFVFLGFFSLVFLILIKDG